MTVKIIYPERPKTEAGFMQSMRYEVRMKKQAMAIVDALMPSDENLIFCLYGGTGYNQLHEEYQNF